jgi:hypothetical protein
MRIKKMIAVAELHDKVNELMEVNEQLRAAIRQLIMIIRQLKENN